MSTESKHTPGPWHCKTVPIGRIWIQDSTTYAVAHVAKSRKESEANAHLIAAAPELLEACEMARDVISGAAQPDEHEALAILDALIAKAKGQP
jgi:hypothetical protein